MTSAIERTVYFIVFAIAVCVIVYLQHVNSHNLVVRQQTALRKCYMKKVSKTREQFLREQQRQGPKQQF